MRKVSQIAVLIFFLISITSCTQEYTCKIKGIVIGRNSEEILIAPITEDFNNIQFLYKGIVIPIKDNKFEYEMRITSVEAYSIFFKEEAARGGGVRKNFFPDSSVVEITLYPDDQSEKNFFKGGELNRMKSGFTDDLYSQTYYYQSKIDSLNKANKFYTEKYQLLTAQIWKTQNQEEQKKLIKERRLLTTRNELYTPEASEIVRKRDSVYKEYRIRQLDYIKTNQNIYSYSLLYEMAADYPKDPDNVNYITSVYPLFSKEFPKHPYTKKIEEILNTISTIRVGGHYIDFSAPTIDGRMVKLSDEIKGKVALIDLWSTWCGPCRTFSKSMIPVYEKYKDKGFTVIGIAGIYKNTDEFKRAIEKDKYPWLNLIEMNNETGIWSKYGASNAGGATFLVDTTGKILDITPSAEEVEKILNEVLN